MKFSSIQIRLINIIVINKCETFTNTPSIKLFINYFNIINVEDKRRGGGGGGGGGLFAGRGVVFTGGREMKIFSTVFPDFGNFMLGKRYFQH